MYLAIEGVVKTYAAARDPISLDASMASSMLVTE
jgi:hypothetical protein